jgi:hypothetical protein
MDVEALAARPLQRHPATAAGAVQLLEVHPRGGRRVAGQGHHGGHEGGGADAGEHEPGSTSTGAADGVLGRLLGRLLGRAGRVVLAAVAAREPTGAGLAGHGGTSEVTSGESDTCSHPCRGKRGIRSPAVRRVRPRASPDPPLPAAAPAPRPRPRADPAGDPVGRSGRAPARARRRRDRGPGHRCPRPGRAEPDRGHHDLGDGHLAHGCGAGGPPRPGAAARWWPARR